jgi:hypothetical protein
MTLTELKEEAGKKFTKIQREEPNAPAVSLKDWNGFSPYAGGPTATAAVVYYLDGNRVRVEKTLDGEYWYILS